jgi:threonylcarbamoyladenosine tRNA methylthiotransferase MtaB
LGHIFPYSPKAGTPAARMPQVPAGAIKDRARRLREASAARRTAWLQSLVGTTQRVLVELDGVTGHAENFAPVSVDAAGGRNEGKVVEVRITALAGDTLNGVPA